MTIDRLKSMRRVLIFLLFSMCMLGFLFAQSNDNLDVPLHQETKTQKSEDTNPFVVKNLLVKNIPHDNGTGLRIEWEPLPFEARVISYRIYRGVTPDSLFFIGELPINPRIGVTVPIMSFYDRDMTIFMDITHPGKLKRERGQPKDSPLFRRIPRDVSVIGSMIEHYNFVGVIPKENFYFKTKRIEKDGRTFAGIKANQLTVAKELKPGNTYYYTVVALNERRVYYPYAEPVAGVPIDTAPETPHDPFGVFVQDSNTLQFEWSQAIYRGDLRAYAIYIVEDEENFLSWKNDHSLGSEAHRIWEYVRPLFFTPTTFAEIEIEDNQIVGSSGGGTQTFNFTFEKPVTEYKYVLSYIDISGQQSYSNPIEIRVINSSELPVIDDIVVRDQKNDKGDYLEFFWGKPFARITSITFLNDARTHLQMSYEFSTNENYKIKNIYFEIYDSKGNYITKVNEFFQDGIFKVRLPKEIVQNELHNELSVKMSFRTNKGLEEEHYLTQKLIFDESILTLRPQELRFKNFAVDDFSFQLLRRVRFNEAFRLSKKYPFFDRNTTDFINFEVSVPKQISNYSTEHNMFLVDYNIDLQWDTEQKTLIQTPIFAAEVPMILENIKTLLAAQTELYDAAETDEERGRAQNGINFYQRRLESQTSLLENNATLKYVNNITSQRARARAIKKYREIERRSFTYQMLLSDGTGLFSVKEITLDENGDPAFLIPTPNWFHSGRTSMLVASLIFGILVAVFIKIARKGKDLYLRPIAGIEEIDNAIGRATEMGRPILFCPGLSGISDVATLAGLAILGRVAKKAAEYDSKILVPCRDNIVLPIAQEIVREAHFEAGRPDSFDRNNVFFVSEQQFAYVAGVNGVMIREKTATNLYMGMFFAESLIMTETGNSTGAIQIAGTDAVTQIPFFITTCDYTLIGEELYAASAYMARQPLQLGTLKAQDYAKFLILTFLILGTIFSSLKITEIIDLFPNR